MFRNRLMYGFSVICIFLLLSATGMAQSKKVTWTETKSPKHEWVPSHDGGLQIKIPNDAAQFENHGRPVGDSGLDTLTHYLHLIWLYCLVPLCTVGGAAFGGYKGAKIANTATGGLVGAAIGMIAGFAGSILVAAIVAVVVVILYLALFIGIVVAIVGAAGTTCYCCCCR